MGFRLLTPYDRVSSSIEQAQQLASPGIVVRIETVKGSAIAVPFFLVVVVGGRPLILLVGTTRKNPLSGDVNLPGQQDGM